MSHCLVNRLQAAVDISKRLFDKWNTTLTAVPDNRDLEVYLDAPLDPDEKIPISYAEWQRLLQPDLSLSAHFCSEDDLDIRFTKDEDHRANFILPIVETAITRNEPPPSGTENSYHFFRDVNILQILLTCLRDPQWVRNCNRGTHTGSFRPDVGLLLQEICVPGRGKKNRRTTGSTPKEELAEKTR